MRTALIRSYNPVESGPAIWLDEPIQSPAQVFRLRRQLREYPESDAPLDIIIDSQGGECGLGLEMLTLLRGQPRRKRVTILHAGSMAAVVAMAGDEIRIVERGTLYLHGVGYARDHLLNAGPGLHLTAQSLRSLAYKAEAADALHVEIFARRTGLPPATITALREGETTLDAHRAVALGFADAVIPMGQADEGQQDRVLGSFPRGVDPRVTRDFGTSLGAKSHKGRSSS